jgi:hypothetical protein
MKYDRVCGGVGFCCRVLCADLHVLLVTWLPAGAGTVSTSIGAQVVALGAPAVSCASASSPEVLASIRSSLLSSAGVAMSGDIIHPRGGLIVRRLIFIWLITIMSTAPRCHLEPTRAIASSHPCVLGLVLPSRLEYRSLPARLTAIACVWGP